MTDIRRVLVVGAGVGGLSAALAFIQRGAAVTLIERRTDFDIPGVGLGQPANALRVYDALGVLEEILAHGYVYDHMTIYDAQRRLIARHKFLLGDERIPAVCALPRSELHRILLNAAKRSGATIRLGLQVAVLDESDREMTAAFTDGTSETFDLVAGFDGIRSATREHIWGTMFTPRFCGIGAWRIQANRPDDVTGMEFLQGIGGKAGAMPITKERMYLFNIRPETAEAVFPRQKMADMWKDRLSQFGDYVATISAGLSEASDIVYSPLEMLFVPWPWHRGRIAIGGDAAHVVAPHLTQGAAMAAEDALVLADETMRQDGSVEQRLMRYAQRRYPRCAFVYTFARNWLDEEQNVRTAKQMEAARNELAMNASPRIAVSDRILNNPVV
jgi:2-polyprenyl-6-methoxyphenol hydroxylase-like FAD-dependent oxidoreductase